MATARDVVPGASVLSRIRTLEPSFVSQSASTSPVGPAPTIKTSPPLRSPSSVRQRLGLPLAEPPEAGSAESRVQAPGGQCPVAALAVRPEHPAQAPRL